MKHIKSFSTYMITESVESIEDIVKLLNTKNQKWDISESGIKIFFDVAPFDSPDQTPYGKLLIMANTVKDLVDRYKKNDWNNLLVASTHVGFIFSDGSILHATSEFGSKKNGVMFEDITEDHAKDIQKHPKDYIIFNLGEDENDVIEMGEEIIEYIKKHKEYDKDYDWAGIRRIFPMLNDVLDPKDGKKFTQGNKDTLHDPKKDYYCSELVMYILLKLKLITKKDLLKIKDITANINHYDITPTELLELINMIGKPLALIKK